MTTNKPGSVNQQPLYGCTSCYEDWTWPAEDLRVFGSECWCDLCWDERRWEFPDQPSWNDLESYTPALQAECEQLRKDAERYRWLLQECYRWPPHSVCSKEDQTEPVAIWTKFEGDDVDAAIDAAMETTQL